MKRSWLWLGLAALVVVLVAARFASVWIPLLEPSTPAVGQTGGSASPGLVAEKGANDAPSKMPAPGGSNLPAPGTAEPLGVLLGMLRIAPESRIGYDRSLFVHWIDADGNGCDTRHEVLIREAIVRPRIGPNCALIGGTWFSLYDGLTFRDPSELQIDHVVALAEAWDSGASAWTSDRRMRFANDLDASFALIAVSAPSNEAKSDSDPADWLPPDPKAECPFLGAWLATKVRWDLTVDQREHDAIAADIRGCPATTMAYLPAGSAGETDGLLRTPGPSGTTASGGACDPAYPTVCIPAPPPDLDCADIPYRNFTVLPPDPHHFDGDRDGIGCEA